MALSTTTARNNYNADGTLSTYAYSFYILSENDLVVTVRNTLGVETNLAKTTDYTVTGVGLTAGGNIVLVNASQAWLTSGFLTNNYKLTIRRVRSLVQDNDIRNQGSFYPETHEDAFDHFVMIAQQQQDALDRTMKAPVTDGTANDMELPLAADRASSYLAFDASGKPIAAAGGASAVSPFMATVLDDATAGAALTTLGVSAFAQTILDDANAAAVIATIGAVTPSGTQTLSNKAFSDALVVAESATPSTPASGFGKTYFKTDGKLYTLNDSGTETEVGSGSGGINYMAVISSSDAETSVGNWLAYADAAAATPVDGAGGAPNTTVTRVAATTLRGTGLFRLTKSTGASRQGEGAGCAFTIAEADKAKVLNISFDYLQSGMVAGSDSATGDLNVYVYDVTNAALIQPTPFKLPGGSTGSWKYSGTFQAASNSTSYRLILHIAGTTNAAATFDFDNVVVGPQVQVFGAVVTDWQSYTPTISAAFTTIANCSFFWRRTGDSIEIQGYFTGTTTSGTTLTISLPSGLSADTNKLNSSGNTASGRLVSDTAANDSPYTIIVDPTAPTVMKVGRQQSALSELSGSSFVSPSNLGVHAVKIPIAGWGSSVVMSQDTDTRVVAACATGNPGSVVAATPIIFPTKVLDTHGAYDAATGRFTCPVAGIYEVSVSGNHGATSQSWFVYKNAVQGVLLFSASTTDLGFAGSTLVSCSADDLLDFRSNNTTDVDNGSISFKRLSGHATIAASEKVNLFYQGNAGTVLTANATNIDWATKVRDSHGAWSGTVFAPPRADWYTFTGSIRLTANVASQLGLYVNGSLKNVATDDVSENFKPFSISYYLNAGDTASFRSDTDATLDSSNSGNWIAISSQ